MPDKKTILSLRNIDKVYYETIALKNISIDVFEGEILSIVGENGAGKSTLIKIISGAIRPTSGSIKFYGKDVSITSPEDADVLGIKVVHQNIPVMPNLTVAENLLLDRIVNRKSFFFNKSRIFPEAEKIIKSVNFGYIDPQTEVKYLSIAQREILSIIKAISSNAKLVLLDEPTASLEEKEIEELFRLIRFLKSKNIAIVFISHHMEEVLNISDRIAVLRNGELVSVGNSEEYNEKKLKELIIGYKTENDTKSSDASYNYNISKSKDRNIILEVKNLSKKGVFENISFNLLEGEVLGFTGLLGSGVIDLCEAIYGSTKYDQGAIQKFGKKLKMNSINTKEIAYLPEDRINKGVIYKNSILNNIIISNIPSRFSIVDKSESTKLVVSYFNKLSIKANSIFQQISELSGGNQQKCLIARVLNTNADIIILAEPTFGVDIKTKDEIVDIIRSFVRENPNKSVILASSELSELIRASDRIIVLKNGQIVGSFKSSSITREELIASMV